MHAKLKAILRASRRGERRGVYAVCTVNRLAIQEALRQARRDRWPVLIEATAQQVNPDGGYSSLTPADFEAPVRRDAAALGTDHGGIVLDGDHVGPHPWASRMAIFKVGPWLTYAFRVAALAPARIERRTLEARRGVQLSQLAETLETAMVQNPQHWRRHYRGAAETFRVAFDRSRAPRG